MPAGFGGAVLQCGRPGFDSSLGRHFTGHLIYLKPSRPAAGQIATAYNKSCFCGFAFIVVLGSKKTKLCSYASEVYNCYFFVLSSNRVQKCSNLTRLLKERSTLRRDPQLCLIFLDSINALTAIIQARL